MAFRAFLIAMAGVLLIAQAGAAVETGNPQFVVKTDLGEIRIELYADKAPETVRNFRNYVDRHFYDGVIFHRVVKGFMIQAGGYTFDLFEKSPGEPVVNESGNGLRNRRGTLAMARLSEPDSARAQFFINLANNRHLDPKGGEPGYTVFGRVVDGMNVVDAIAREPVRREAEFTHLPKVPVRILSITPLEQP
ncbi:MAG: peptidylprolyl isomerase A [Porticoccaceae bacterium]|nr:peptidylprolyl isomerase A [Porticoccaceae bacterium]